MNISRVKALWLIPLLFSSCSKDHAVIPGFSSADLALLHYTVGDTLTFANSAGKQFSVYADSVSDHLVNLDTVSCLSTGKSSFSRFHILYFNNDSILDAPWRLSISRLGADYHSTTKVGFFVSSFPFPYDTLDFGQFNLIEDYGDLIFGNRKISHEYSCGDKLDSYSVNGRTYYNVFRIMDFNSCTYDGSFHVKIRVMYYSVEEGIIAFELSDASLWFSI